MKKTLTIMAAMLIVGITAWAKNDIKVLAPKHVEFGQQFEIGYLVDGKGQQITLKTNDKFDVISGPYRHAENCTVREKNKLVTRTRTLYTYRLVALESGSVKLPKAKVALTRGSVSSKAITIEVTEPRWDPWRLTGFNTFFEQPMLPACDHHHGRAHHDHGNCPHHQVHIETFTPEQIDTTGCVVTVCAPDSAVEGETFCLSYAIGAQADSIQLSDTTDFEIVGGPGYGTSWQSVWQNGQQQNRFEQRYTYIVRARKAGELNLPKAQVWVGQTRKESEQKTISIQPSETK